MAAEEARPKIELVTSTPAPRDADDIEALLMDPALGDGITNLTYHVIPVGKPKDSFRPTRIRAIGDSSSCTRIKSKG
jgi:hypothetical protein